MKSALCKGLHLLIEPNLQKNQRWFFYFWAVLLHAGGSLFWAYFLNWGIESSYLFKDWFKITLPRLAFVQTSLRMGILPLHMLETNSLHDITNRFLTLPDLLVSPQVIFLRWLDVGAFIILNIIFSFIIGGIGLVWLSRKLNLSIVAFTLLFFFFNFNGHLVSHFAIGHYIWTSYYLYPWLIGLTISLFHEQTIGWKWVAQVSAILFLIFLQGGYHHFIWSLFFLGFLVLIFPRHLFRLLQTCVVAVLLSTVRLLPPFLNLGNYRETTQFIGGYAGLLEFWQALTYRFTIGDQGQTLPPVLNIHYGIWEFSLYVGLAGALFLVGFGIISAIRNRSLPDSYFPLLVPVLGLTVLSLDSVFRYLRILIPLPIFVGERMITRMAILPLILLMVLAVIEFQRFLNKQKWNGYVIWLGAGSLVIFVHDLWQNAYFWRLTNLVTFYKVNQWSPELAAPAKIADPIYTKTLWAGLAITLLTAIFLGWKIYQEKNKIHPAEPNIEALKD